MAPHLARGSVLHVVPKHAATGNQQNYLTRRRTSLSAPVRLSVPPWSREAAAGLGVLTCRWAVGAECGAAGSIGGPSHPAEKARTGHQDSGKGVPGPAPVSRPGAGSSLPRPVAHIRNPAAIPYLCNMNRVPAAHASPRENARERAFSYTTQTKHSGAVTPLGSERTLPLIVAALQVA
jgi:hypothetical protein